MGAIWFDGAGLRGTLSELVGKKSGFALTLEELLEHSPSSYRDTLTADDEATLRIRSEDFQELLCGCLYSLGTISTPYVVMPGMNLLREAQNSLVNQDKLLELHQFILAEHKALLENTIASNKSTIDPTPLIRDAEAKFGLEGARWSLQYVLEVDTYLKQSAMSAFSRFESIEPARLRELFESECIEPPDGGFIDQRFIDFLQANPEKLHEMNWRKFEGLTAEFFERYGFHVEIGPGRNDGGIDIRVWDPAESSGSPPAILVQCKRYKDSIQQAVVKSLWADVLHENAKSGLIVTTSRLAPSSEAVIDTRAYSIDSADSETLQQWLMAMRTPDSGVFLAH